MLETAWRIIWLDDAHISEYLKCQLWTLLLLFVSNNSSKPTWVALTGSLDLDWQHRLTFSEIPWEDMTERSEVSAMATVIFVQHHLVSRSLLWDEENYCQGETRFEGSSNVLCRSKFESSVLNVFTNIANITLTTSYYNTWIYHPKYGKNKLWLPTNVNHPNRIL